MSHARTYLKVHPGNCEALTPILTGNEHLRKLEVNLHGDDEHEDVVPAGVMLTRWTAFCEAAQTAPSLRVVTLCFGDNPSSEEYVRMGLLLQRTRQIRELVLENCFGDPAISSLALTTAIASRFVHALAHNSTLESLDIVQDDHAEMYGFVKRVLLGTRLKKLRVGDDLSPEHMEMLVPIMAQNYHLEKLKFSFRRGYSRRAARTKRELQKKLNVIGTLNKFGRRYLVDRGPGCKAAGVELLSAVSSNLDCLFYHLRENPSLCERVQKNAGLVKTASSSSNVHGNDLPCAKKRRTDG